MCAAVPWFAASRSHKLERHLKFKNALKVECEKSHTIAEELTLPNAVDKVNIMTGRSSENIISLSVA